MLFLLLSLPSVVTLTRTIVPVCHSETNTSSLPFVSPSTKLLAFDLNATKRPSALIAGSPLEPFGLPLAGLLTRVSSPLTRSWTKTSAWPVSPATRLFASDLNAI